MTTQDPRWRREHGGWWWWNDAGEWQWVPDPPVQAPPTAAPGQHPSPMYVQAAEPKRRKWPWIAASLVVLVVAVAAAGSGGGETPVQQVADSTTGQTAGSSTPKPATKDKPAATPKPGPPGSMTDGDWRLDTLTVEKQEYGSHFSGRARITYIGDDTSASNLFTITLFIDGKDVGILNGSLNDMAPGQTKTADLYSLDDFVSGKLTYTFQNDL